MNIEKYKKELESGIYEGVQDGTFYIGGKVVEKVLRDAVNEALAISRAGNRFNSKYTPPFRVGRKQGKAVLDANGREVIFFKDSEEQAKKYCDYLNGC